MPIKESLIWIEFTKTTYGFQPWEREATIDRSKTFSEFLPHKKELKPHDYIQKASGGGPIRSSIPKAVDEAARRADQSAKAAQQTRNIIATLSVLALLGLGFAGAEIYISLINYIETSQRYIQEKSEKIDRLKGKVEELEEQLESEN
jgi:hypothetical protein